METVTGRALRDAASRVLAAQERKRGVRFQLSAMDLLKEITIAG